MRSAKRIPRLFLLFAFLIGPGFAAQALTEKERDHLRMMTEWFPYVSCQDAKFLKQCYTWSTDECEGTVANSSASCLNQYKPQWSAPVTAPLDRWQDKLIDCVHRDIQAKLKGRAISTISCKNRGGG